MRTSLCWYDEIPSVVCNLFVLSTRKYGWEGLNKKPITIYFYSIDRCLEKQNLTSIYRCIIAGCIPLISYFLTVHECKTRMSWRYICRTGIFNRRNLQILIFILSWKYDFWEEIPACWNLLNIVIMAVY